MTAEATIRGGTIITLDRALPRATSIALGGGRVSALGDDCANVAERDTKGVGLDGAVVVPGLTDAHCHLVQHGIAERREADLRGVSTVDELLDRLRQHAERKNLQDDGDTWLLGRSFDQDRLDERRWPTRDDLDSLPWHGPVCLTRVCGHARVVNSKAQEATRRHRSQFPVRESGLYTEDELTPIFEAIPSPTDAEYLDAARWATHAAARAGFTTVHCLVGAEPEIRALKTLRERNELGCRIRVQLPFGMLRRLDELHLSRDDAWLSLGNVKLFADGSLGAQTAALTHPYHDAPTTSGELLIEAEPLAELVVRVWQADLQPCVHAIGDLAVDTVVEAYERALTAYPAGREVAGRARLEHASIVRGETIEKLARLQIACCVQPQFVASDWWTEKRLGLERVRWAYPFRDLLDAGVPLLGGTDCPVEKLDAMAALHCAVTRPGEDWCRRFGQELRFEEALRMFCVGPAEAMERAEDATTLAVGSRADFLVLSGDLPGAASAGGCDLAVVEAWIDGRRRCAS